MQSAVCFLALIGCHVWAQSARFIIAFVVWSEAEAENTASLTEEWSRVGQPAKSSATQEYNVLVLMTLPATGGEGYAQKLQKFTIIQTHHTLHGKCDDVCITVIT